MSLPAGAVMLLHTSEEGQVRQEQTQPMTRMLMKRGRRPTFPVRVLPQWWIRTFLLMCSRRDQTILSKPLDIKETVDLNTNGFKR